MLIPALVACALPVLQPNPEGAMDLLLPGAWSAAIDKGGTQLELVGTAEAPVTLQVNADGGEEDYPKVNRVWDEPQDWSAYMRMRCRVRVVCDTPGVGQKQLAFVYYDAKTLRQDLPDHPMTQQVVSHMVPVNQWVTLNDWILDINRTAIRTLSIYLYEVPPAEVHSYRWEFAELTLEGVGEKAVAFDTETYADGAFRATPGPEAQAVAAMPLELGLAADGAIAQVLVRGQRVGGATDQVSGLLVRDAAAGGPPVAVGGTVRRDGDAVVQSSELAELGLAVDATYRAEGDMIRVSGLVRDLRGQDRAVTITLAVPLEGWDWRWWDSVASARTAAPDDNKEYAYYETGAEYGLNGAHSKYPLGAVTSPERAGLTLAVHMDQPVVHRIGYTPKVRLFHISADFGLVADVEAKGRRLSEAPFEFLLYPHDPAWGFRSALQRYYTAFPDFFTCRVERQGGWFVWGDVSQTEGALEAGFGFHWGPAGPEAVKWDNEHGVLAVQYIEPELFQLTMGDFDRAPTSEESWARAEKLAAGDAEETGAFLKLGYSGSYVPAGWVAAHSREEAVQTVGRAALASLIFGASGQPSLGAGQFPWMTESQWGTIFPCSLDPDIPGGKGVFCRDVYLETGFEDMEAAGAHYDGVALDSFGGYGMFARANYRREHFPHTDTQPSFGATDHQPCLVAAFSSVEFARDLAEREHARGHILMANCSWNVTPAWLTFAAPYLDVFGAEAPRFADPEFARAIAYRKPCTDLPYNPVADWELPWHLVHGIFPGHGNKVELMAQYAEPLQQLAAAGWEPVTYARVEPAELRIERFGSGKRVFLVVHNPAEQPAGATVAVDWAALGLATDAPIAAVVGDAPTRQGDGLALTVPGQGTVMFAVGAE